MRSESVGQNDFWRCRNVTRSGTDGRWQHETPYKEELELLRHSTDLRFEGPLLETFLGDGKLRAWTSVKVRECYNEVEQEDDGRQSIA